MRCIATNFVPVALNLYKIRDAKDAGGDFFRAVQKQKPQYQGLWIASADGKVLASHQQTKDNSDWYGKWPKLVLADLDLRTDNGAITFIGPTGDVTARCSNGAIQSTANKGKLHVTRAMGRFASPAACRRGTIPFS